MGKIIKILDIAIILLFNIYTLNVPIAVSLIITTSIFVGLYAFRTYDNENMNSLNENLIRTTIGTIIGYIIILLFYVFIERYINRYVFLYNLLFILAAIPLLHKIEYKLYAKHFPVKRYLVIGRKNEIGSILNEITKKSMHKLQFIEYINPSPEKLERLIAENYEITDPLYFLKPKSKKTITTTNFNAIIVTDPQLEELVKPQIQKYKQQKIPIEYLPNIAEKYLKRIPIEVAERFKEYYEVIFQNIKETPGKKIMDKIISTLGLILTFPFMIIISLMIYFEDKTPIVFVQERVGENGKVFKLHKFRSMKNTDPKKHGFAANEQDRILKIGKVIRPIRMDEILQFWDIFIGSMSFIGPRPEQVKFVKEYEKEIPFYAQRHKLKTGLTGWAQIMYQYSSSLEETKMKLSYDLYYVKNRNFILDLQIILKTIEAVVLKRGAK